MRAQSNYRHIKGTINGVAVTFAGGAGSYVNGGNTGLCQVCHTTTNHHQADGAAPLGQDHNNAAVCTGCHSHAGTAAAADAFKAPARTADTPHDGVTNCLACHVDGADPMAALPNSKCLGCHDGTDPLATVVDTHHSTKYGTSEACVDCHNPMDPQSNFKHIRSTVNGQSVVLTARLHRM